MVVDQPDLPLSQLEPVGEKDDVPEDAFRAEDLGVFVAHLVLRERVEGRGEDGGADVGDPVLQGVVVQLVLLDLGQVDHH